MIQVSYFSGAGNREINEDSVLSFDDASRKCFAIADGLGGHGYGDIASQTVLNAIQKSISQIGLDDSISNTMKELFQNAQTALLNKQIEMHAKLQMKTTLTMLYVQGKRLCWGHIGDTRLYAFSNNKVSIRTLDHSVPQMLVLAGDIPERKIRNHPDRSLLLRVLGIEWEEPEPYEISEEYDLDTYQAFLICSDGFWELINERQMCKCLKKSSTSDEWLQRMREIVETNGKACDMDNYSAIAIVI